MEEEADPQLEAVQKTRLHDQCKANDHVTDNIGLEGDLVYCNRYNKVAVLYFNGHHENFGNHREG